MNDREHDIDRAEAARITHEIEQTFAFLADVLDAPDVLDLIPSGATLHLREVPIGDRRYRLTAYRTPRMRSWAARVTGVPAGGAELLRLPSPARGTTPAAALDAMEAVLRTAAARPALAS